MAQSMRGTFSGLKGVLSLFVLASGCDGGALPADEGDGAMPPVRDLAEPVFIDGPPDPCSGDDGGRPLCGTPCTPECRTDCLGPSNNLPFPLATDPMPDPNEKDSHVLRDEQGNLIVKNAFDSFGFIWAPNATDWQRGTISKLNAKMLREVARYYTVTCFSNKAGSRLACDGIQGCCAADDPPRFLARTAQKPDPGHQAVLLNGNRPSRTSADFNGDIVVANRAPGGQASVTRIAGDVSECRDYNHNGKIDTSADQNGDGLIQTDCNGDGIPDDIDGVKGLPCLNGKKQEFFGLDDECVLWTTNVGVAGNEARGLSVVGGNGALSDVWVATLPAADLSRIDATSALITSAAQLPAGCRPVGLASDALGVLWSVSGAAGPLCFYDSKSGKSGTARPPSFGAPDGYGIALDRDQDVLIGGGTSSPEAYRYAPDRSNGPNNLGMGYWLSWHQAGAASGATGPAFGIAVDARTANTYFAWLSVGDGHVVAIPASNYPHVKMDQQLDGSKLPAVNVTGYALTTVLVDVNQNVVALAGAAGGTPSAVVRILVDKTGAFTNPDLKSSPTGMNLCPAGDRCLLKDSPKSEPGTDGYSDLASFGLRNDSVPAIYSYIFKGCADSRGGILPTFWTELSWDASVPMHTALRAAVTTGNSPVVDVSWGGYTTLLTSPADLSSASAAPDPSYLQVSFIMQGNQATPVLKAFCVKHACAAP